MYQGRSEPSYESFGRCQRKMIIPWLNQGLGQSQSLTLNNCLLFCLISIEEIMLNKYYNHDK